MAWIVLLIAGLFEIIWAVALKYSDGFSRPLFSGVTLIAMVISFGGLAYALKSIPIGTAYAVWTGIGALGVAIVGMIMFNDSTDIKRLLCIGFIVLGIIGLKLLDTGTSQT